MYKNCVMEFAGEKIDTTININQITSLQTIVVLNIINDNTLFVVIDDSIWLILSRHEIDNYDCFLTEFIRNQ